MPTDPETETVLDLSGRHIGKLLTITHGTGVITGQLTSVNHQAGYRLPTVFVAMKVGDTSVHFNATLDAAVRVSAGTSAELEATPPDSFYDGRDPSW